MAIQASVRVRNDVLVLNSLRRIDSEALNAASRGLARGLEIAVGIIQRDFLSGPRPSKLDVRTTRLRNSITKRVDVVSKRGVLGRVGSNVAYAGFHEFGYHGTQQVRAHTRVLREVNNAGELVDTRRVLRDRQGNVIGYRESRLRAAIRNKTTVATGRVKAHSRQVDYEGKPFVRPGVRKAMPLILGEIAKELATLG